MRQIMKLGVPDDFDWKYYLEKNKDVASFPLFKSKEGAEKHWIKYGQFENRIYKKTNISYNTITPIKKQEPVIEKKIVVYTCVSGKYDNLREIKNKHQNVDYICFTDNFIESKTWEIKEIPKYLEHLENTKKARCLKINPHLFLSQYDISLWVDGNIEIVGDVFEFIHNTLKENVLYIPKHPQRTCIYDEKDIIIKLNKDTENIVNSQIEKYSFEGYPSNYGLCQSNIILRKHNDPDCVKIDKQWWNELLEFSKRDQLSFNYVCWKNQDIEIGILNPNLMCSKYFQHWGHKRNTPTKIPLNYGDKLNFINGKPV